MYNCKELNSLPVLSLYEGELIGKINKLYFDKKLKKLLEMEIICENDAKLILPTKNIYHVGKNAITIKNNQAVELKNEESNLCCVPIGVKAYSICGEYLGVVEEVVVSDKFVTEKISLENQVELDVKNLASLGKNTLIFFNKDNRVNINNFVPTKQPKEFKKDEEVEVKTLPDEENTSNAVPVETNLVSASKASEFLLGRICTKDILNFNNEILIKAHSIINKKNLKEISKFGKLKELMLYSVEKN